MNMYYYIHRSPSKNDSGSFSPGLLNLTEYLFIFIYYYYDYYRGDQEQFASARRRWGKPFILSTGVYAVLYRNSPLAVRSPFLTRSKSRI